MGRHRCDREGGAIPREMQGTRDQSIDLLGSSRIALKNGLTQAGIDSLYQQIATGALVMLAVAADQYLGRGQRA